MIVYSGIAINDRLLGVITAIDGGSAPGNLILTSSGTTISTIQLNKPCGTVNGGVLTFNGQLLDPAAASTGNVNGAVIKNGDGTTMISGLSVGIPTGTYDIIISNGLNSTVITAGQTVQLLSAQITGS